MNVRTLVAGALAFLLLPGAAFAQGAGCQGGKSFEAWLDAFKAEARAQGISDRTLRKAAPDMVFDQAIKNKDHGTPNVFQQSFVQFSDRMANNNRLQAGK